MGITYLLLLLFFPNPPKKPVILSCVSIDSIPADLLIGKDMNDSNGPTEVFLGLLDDKEPVVLLPLLLLLLLPPGHGEQESLETSWQGGQLLIFGSQEVVGLHSGGLESLNNLICFEVLQCKVCCCRNHGVSKGID